MGKVSEQLVALAGNCRRKNSQEFAPQRALLSDGRTDRVINHLPAAGIRSGGGVMLSSGGCLQSGRSHALAVLP